MAAPLNLCTDSYVIGLPVIIELLEDGSVRATVDLAEAARARDVGDEVDWSDEDVDRVCEAVQVALDLNKVTVGAVDYRGI